MSIQRNITSAPAHAKYHYKTRGYFPRQTKWLDLTVTIFNTDVADVLLSEAEKKCVLIDLSRGFTKSETLGNSGDIYHNTTVRKVKQMLKGDVAIVKWQVCAAILRHQLQIPEHWLEDPTFRQYHDGMVYLRYCSTSAKAYSKNGIKRAMRGAEFAESLSENHPGGGDDDAPAGHMPSTQDVPHTSVVRQNKSRKRKKPETSPPSTLTSGSASSERHPFTLQNPRQTKRRTERDESAATVQGHIEVIEIKSEDEDEDVKTALKRPRKHAGSDGEEGRNCVGDDKISQMNAVETRNAGEAQHEVERQITTETNAAEMQKTIPELRKMIQFLPNIAVSESKTFRKDILRPRIAMIRSNGWNDLVQWARQLIVADGKEYRQYLAEGLRDRLTERVNKLSG